MKCSGCGHENRDAAKFCEECATPLGRKCTRCGAEIRSAAKFCDECAAPVTGASPSRSDDPRSYTPKHLAEKILTSRSALEGERKQVTVLFADVKGSVELSAQLGPEEWHGIMDGFFRILADGVHRFEGAVNQYTGDGIMALFGAPIAHEDHAQRACYAALHLREELRRYQEDVKRRHAVTFSVRMGINSGEVVVGKIGDDLRMDYTAQGETVGLAHRLQELADPGTTYLSEHTMALVSGLFTLRDLGLFEVKGIAKPLRVHELEGVGQLRTRLEVSRSRGFSQFVGREPGDARPRDRSPAGDQRPGPGGRCRGRARSREESALSGVHGRLSCAWSLDARGTLSAPREGAPVCSNPRDLALLLRHRGA